MKSKTAFFLILFTFLFPTLAHAELPLGTPLTKRAMVLEFNPVLEDHSNQRLTQYKGWNNPSTLEGQYLAQVTAFSSGRLNYQIVSRQILDIYPEKTDGFSYTDASYLACITDTSTCHPDTAQSITINYQKVIDQYQICQKLNTNEIDELWLWGGPYFGYWESTMAGSDAYFTNGIIVTGTTCTKPLHIMGFNYERGVSEMVHDLGHRTEGTMMKMFSSSRVGLNSQVDLTNLYQKFTTTDYLTPGNAGCGYIHSAPNSSTENYTSTTTVASLCDDWSNYPAFTNQKTNVSCTTWNCDSLGFYTWWFRHLPKYSGIANGKLNNWWYYIADYPAADNCYSNPACYSTSFSPTLTPTPTHIPTPTVYPSPTPSPTLRPTVTPSPITAPPVTQPLPLPTVVPSPMPPLPPTKRIPSLLDRLTIPLAITDASLAGLILYLFVTTPK